MIKNSNTSKALLGLKSKAKNMTPENAASVTGMVDNSRLYSTWYSQRPPMPTTKKKKQRENRDNLRAEFFLNFNPTSTIHIIASPILKAYM